MARQSTRRPSIAGVNLRRLRDDRGLTQEQLAAKSGVSRVTIARIESGLVPSPGLDVMTSLASALACPLQTLFAGPQETPALEPHIQDYLRSPWVMIARPTDAELEWLRGTGPTFWLGWTPTPEVLHLILEAYRRRQK